MANFHTHLNIGLLASSLSATLCVISGLSSVYYGIILFGVGVVGSLLPDIDLPHSRPARLGFEGGSLFIATLAVMISYPDRLTFDALIVFGAVYLIVRYGVISVFNKITVHRGIVHSVPFMLMSALIVGHIFWYMGFKADMVWLSTGFLFGGAIVHLLLDELYSVNVFGLRLKKSFGTALKFIEFKKLPLYIVVYILIIILAVNMPNYEQTIHTLIRFILNFI